MSWISYKNTEEPGFFAKPQSATLNSESVQLSLFWSCMGTDIIVVWEKEMVCIFTIQNVYGFWLRLRSGSTSRSRSGSGLRPLTKLYFQFTTNLIFSFLKVIYIPLFRLTCSSDSRSLTWKRLEAKHFSPAQVSFRVMHSLNNAKQGSMHQTKFVIIFYAVPFL